MTRSWTLAAIGLAACSSIEAMAADPLPTQTFTILPAALAVEAAEAAIASCKGQLQCRGGDRGPCRRSQAASRRRGDERAGPRSEPPQSLYVSAAANDDHGPRQASRHARRIQSHA